MIESVRGVIELQISWFTSSMTAAVAFVAVLDFLIAYTLFTAIPKRKPVNSEVTIVVVAGVAFVMLVVEIVGGV